VLGLRPLTGLNIRGIAADNATIVVAVNAADDPMKLGIWRSVDTGKTWAQVSGAPGSGIPVGSATDLAVDPSERTRLFTNGGTLGIFRSDDGGEKWSRVSTGAMDALLTDAWNVRIAAAPGGHVYVAIVSGENQQLSGVFRSADSGSHWISLDLPVTAEGGIHPGKQGGTNLSLAADPTAPHIIYIGGDRQAPSRGTDFPRPNTIGATDYSGRLFRGDSTKSAGRQWVHLTHSRSAAGGGTASGSAPHADSRDLALAADGSLLEADDGGVYRRTIPRDSSGDWLSVNGNLQLTEFHSVAWDANLHVAVGGAQDTGTPRQGKGGVLKWESLSTSDGGGVAVDTTSTPGRSIVYSSTWEVDDLHRTMYRATGQFDNSVKVGLRPSAGHPRITKHLCYCTPITLNAVDARRLILAGENGVFESTNRGDDIRLIASLRAEPHALAYGSGTNADALYVGADGGVYVRLTAKGSLARSKAYPGEAVVALAVDPLQPRTAVALDDTGIYRTTDGGTKWASITGNLAALGAGRLRSIVFTDDGLVLGANSGVFRASPPAFTSWVRLAGLPRAPVLALAYSSQDRTLVAGTLGRGAWTLTFPGNSPPPTPPRAPGSSLAAVQTPGAPLLLREGVVIDPERRLIFLPRPDSSIEAVAIASGRQQWQTRAAAQPLGLSRDRLIAQTDERSDRTLAVALLDAATGVRQGGGEWTLPAGVIASIDPTPDGRFSAFAIPSENDALVLWKYEPTARQGARPDTPSAIQRPTPRGSPPPAKQAPDVGAARLDIDTGAITAAGRDEKSLSLFTARDVPFALLSMRETLPQLGPDQVLSVDGRHLITVQQTADDSSWEKYLFIVTERATERRVGELRSYMGSTRFYVSGDILLYESSPFTRQTETGLISAPLMIRGFDLTAGKELARIPTRRRVVHGAVVSADGRYVFISVEGVAAEPGTVEQIDLATLKTAATVDVAPQAGGIDVLHSTR